MSSSEHVSTYTSRIEHQRQEKDKFFAQGHNSPLGHHGQHGFQGLDYFPINEKLFFDGIAVEEFADPKEEYIMQTNTGAVQDYEIYGQLKFPVNGQEYELLVYTSSKTGDNYFFVPFWDETVLSKETYGAGRYLELEKKPDGISFIADFNIAYNPFCAYNEHYSCPLTPPDNRLKVRIEAGEKDFKQL